MYCTLSPSIKRNASTKTIAKLCIASTLISLSACNTLTMHSDPITTIQSQLKQQSKLQQASQASVANTEQIIAVGQATPDLLVYHGRYVVMATKNNSYVMDQGGLQFFYLLNQLDSMHLDVPKILNFNSHDKSKRFDGNISMAYVNLKEDLTQKELLFLFENNAQNCSSANDFAVNALRFCFDIPVQGQIYPAVSNIETLRSNLGQFGQSLEIAIHTTSTKSEQSKDIEQSNSLAPFHLEAFHFAD